MTGDLFGSAATEVPARAAMVRTAVFSGEGDCWRDELRRVWDERRPTLVVCMLNPSHASHLVDDLTVLALIHFATLWGYGGLLIVNLYSWRSPSPKAMMAVDHRVGPGNGAALEAAMAYAAAHGGRMLAAWGTDGNFEGRADWLVSRATRVHHLELICLGRTRDGSPKHPMARVHHPMARGKHRIPRDQQPIVWRPAA